MPGTGESWAPAPVTVAGLRATATAAASGFALATAHGPVGFLAGVNLGSTTPGFQPGELSIDAGQYRDWFAAMRRLGVRVVRIYTIHPPAFYEELRRYNAAHPDQPLYLMQGVYQLADAQATRGGTAPVAFVNWPTTDPLRHPDEPMAGEDLAGIDANQIRATEAWPGGQFASYHAYPYYPDFLRHRPDLARTVYDGQPDPYAGYLAALRAHHAEAGIPVMIAELGVPSSIGTAHDGPLGRGQGAHSEQEAMRIDAQLLGMTRDAGLAGGLLFEWTDEWFKATWNTVAHQLPAGRRQLWHDALTNEQWFGLLAADLVLQLDPGARTGQEWVRRELDPVTLDRGVTQEERQEASGDWRTLQLVTNRALLVPTTGQRLPVEVAAVGRLLWGDWRAPAADYDSRAVWHVDGATLRLRLPWAMAGMADPSSHRALLPGAGDGTVEVAGIGVGVRTGDRGARLDAVTWQGWQRPGYRMRLKAGAGVVRDAFAAL